MGFANEDKIIHAFLGAMAVVVCNSVGRSFGVDLRVANKTGILAAFAGLVFIEWRQTKQPDRSPDWEDVLLGMVGALTTYEALS